MRTEPSKKGKRRIWWIVAASLSVLLAVAFVFDPFGSMGLKGELAQARAAGFPVEPEDIFLDPAPRDEDNAALVFDRMVDLGGASGDYYSEQNVHFRAVSAGYDDFDIDFVYAYFEDNAELLLLAERAAELPAYRAKKDWSNPVIVLLPEPAAAKEVSRAFAARAMLSLLDGDVQSALDDLQRILQIANHMDRAGCSLGHFVAVSARVIYFEAVEYMAAFAASDKVFLKGVILQLQNWPAGVDWTQALRLTAYTSVWLPQHREEMEAEYAYVWNWREGLPSDDFDWERLSWRLPRTAVDATRLLLEHWTVVLNSYDPDTADPITWARSLDEAFSTASGFWQGAEALAYALVPVLKGIGTSAMNTRARREVLKSSLEALLAMRNSAKDPFESIGLDPFTGASLLYKKRKDGFVIYSVGQDGVDDGGQVVRTSGHRDIVFEYPKKRQPAPAGYYNP